MKIDYSCYLLKTGADIKKAMAFEKMTKDFEISNKIKLYVRLRPQKLPKTILFLQSRFPAIKKFFESFINKENIDGAIIVKVQERHFVYLFGQGCHSLVNKKHFETDLGTRIVAKFATIEVIKNFKFQNRNQPDRIINYTFPSFPGLDDEEFTSFLSWAYGNGYNVVVPEIKAKLLVPGIGNIIKSDKYLRFDSIFSDPEDFISISEQILLYYNEQHLLEAPLLS